MKGWYGDRFKHKLASKGVKTINIQIVPDKEEIFRRTPDEKLAQLNDKEKERIMFLIKNSPADEEIIDLSLIEKGWIQKYEDKVIPSDRFYENKSKKVVSYEKPKRDITSKYGIKSTLQLRKEISYFENKIKKSEYKLRKLRRGLNTPEEIGFGDLSKKDTMRELEFDIANIRTDLRLSKNQLKLNTDKMKTINTKSNENTKTIYNIDKYHNRRIE